MTSLCWRWWPTHSCRQPRQWATHSLAAELHLLHNLLLLHHRLVAQNKPLCVCKILYQGALSRTEQAKSVAILAKVPYLPSRESVVCLKMSTKHVNQTRPILFWMFSLDNYFAFTIYIGHAVCMLFVHWRCSKGQSPSLLIRMSASQSPQIATNEY